MSAEEEGVMDSSTVIEFGVVYPDGSADWNTAASFGTIDTPEARVSFREQYRLRLAGLGVVSADVTFVTREKTVTVTEPVLIEDPEPVVELEVPIEPVVEL